MKPVKVRERGCFLNEDPKTKTLDLRPYDIKRRPTDLKRRLCDLKRRSTSKMSERCQAAYGWSDDIVCYGIVGAVEQWNSWMWVLSVCARNALQRNYIISFICLLNVKFNYLLVTDVSRCRQVKIGNSKASELCSDKYIFQRPPFSI